MSFEVFSIIYLHMKKKLIANPTRQKLVNWRPCLLRCLSDMFLMFLFTMMSMFNCDNCSLTRFTVADAFWLSQRLVCIDKMTLQFWIFSLINCFSANRSFPICWWEEFAASLFPTCRIRCSQKLILNDTCP